MGWFTSKKKKAVDSEQTKKTAFRAAEQAIQQAEANVSRMEKEKAQLWEEARKHKQNGQKAATARALKSYRAKEVHIANLEMKRWGFQQMMEKIHLAETDQALNTALQGLSAVKIAAPEQLEATLGVLGVQMENFEEENRIWRQLYNTQMATVENAHDDTIPSEGELLAQLDDEVAADVEGSAVSVEPSQQYAGSPVEEEFSSEAEEVSGAGHNRLKKLLGDKS